MRVLFIAPRLPVPADTGAKIRTLNILKQVAKTAEVDLACFSFEKDDEKHAEDLRNQNIKVHLVPVRKFRFLKKVKDVFWNPWPLSVVKYYSPQMEKTLTSLLKETRYNAVHIDHIHMVHYQNLINGLPCFVDEHNVEYKILERCTDVENTGWKKQIYRMQAKKMKKFESTHIKKFTRCFAVSKDDQELLTSLIGGEIPVDVIANGVDTGYFRSQNGNIEKQEEALVFTGSMDWLPNEDAVIYFCQDILPLIWKENEKIKFYIVGKNPSAAVKAQGEKDQRVVVTGSVEDVRPYIERSKIFVVPIRVGGGTRLKILEAMSMQKAVVSTGIGAEGISYKEGEHITIGDTSEEFAKNVLQLLNDDQRRSQMGLSARDFVCRLYDWNIVGERLKNVYQEVAHAGRN